MAGANDSPLAPSSLAAFARNEDGSAKDPAAFREALLKDPERIKALQVPPDDLLTCINTFTNGGSSNSRQTLRRPRAVGLMIALPPATAADDEQHDPNLSSSLLESDIGTMQKTLKEVRSFGGHEFFAKRDEDERGRRAAAGARSARGRPARRRSSPRLPPFTRRAL